MRVRHSPGLARRILIIGLTTWGLVMIVPDLYRVLSPLDSAGFAADNDGRIYDVQGPFAQDSESPAWGAGLRVGDRLDLAAMRCAPPPLAYRRAETSVLREQVAPWSGGYRELGTPWNPSPTRKDHSPCTMRSRR
jgi:hypothetical protein